MKAAPTIGIRRENKHAWERRAPLTPGAVRTLVESGVAVRVQPSSIRVFTDASYRAAGAVVHDDLSDCGLVLAVKELPMSALRQGGAYAFFSHTIKGQAHNMGMLRRMKELGCTLYDYERIVDDADRRLVFFGQYAGLAGMIDTLHVLGHRLLAEGIETPLTDLRLAHGYPDLAAAEAAVSEVGRRIAREGVPSALAPLVCGFAGYGNVSRGAQHIFDLLPVETVAPERLAALVSSPDPPRDRVFKVVFEERHMVARLDGGAFELSDYYEHPERYGSVFGPHAAALTVLVNAIFWTDEYPRLVTKAWLAAQPASGMRLRVIGDISCDIGGAVECTVKATTPGSPAYVYNPANGTVKDGVEGPGIAMMTTDCLPCELPRESSVAFSDALLPLVSAMARVDHGGSLEAAGLPPEVERSVLLWRGEHPPAYAYMEQFIEPG